MAGKVRYWLVYVLYIAESPKLGTKRFNSITKTIHFAHLVILFIYDKDYKFRIYYDWEKRRYFPRLYFRFRCNSSSVKRILTSVFSPFRLQTVSHKQKRILKRFLDQRGEGLSQRIYISVRRDSTPPPCVFQTFAHPASPCSVCSILQLPDYLTEQAGERLGGQMFGRRRGVLIYIYSLD